MNRPAALKGLIAAVVIGVVLGWGITRSLPSLLLPTASPTSGAARNAAAAFNGVIASRRPRMNNTGHLIAATATRPFA